MTWRLIGRSVLALSLAATLGSCGTPTAADCQLNQTASGALIGAGIGGALGAIGAAAGGANSGTGLAIAAGAAIAGAAIGAIIGEHQDEVCHQLALNQALDQAMAANAAWQTHEAERGAAAKKAAMYKKKMKPVARAKAVAAAPPRSEYKTVAWANKMTNDGGAITPLSSIAETASNQVCMSFDDQQTSNGQTHVVTGKACRGPNGEWKPVT